MLFTFLLILLLNNLAFSQNKDSIKTLDKAGNIIKLQFKYNGKLGNYIEHYQYNKENQLVKEYATDSLGKITSRVRLAPIVTYEYSVVNGNKTKTERCFDKDMNPDKLDVYPFYHKVIHTYNSKGDYLENWALSLYGKTIERIAYEYNDQGLKSTIKYLDDEGNIDKKSIGYTRYQYDDQKRLISKEHYDYQNERYSNFNTPHKKEIIYLENFTCSKYYNHNLQEIIAKKPPTCHNAPDFLQEDVNGKTISLSAFKGKIVVLYFWGSSYSGAKFLHPKLRPFYDYYKDKIEFVSIALERPNEKEKWIKSIEDTKLDWATNLGAFDYFNSKVAIDYNIESIPQFFVINPDGILIGSGLDYIGNVDNILRQFFGEK